MFDFGTTGAAGAGAPAMAGAGAPLGAGAPAGFGAAGGLGGAAGGGLGEMIAAIRSALGGAVGGGADILGAIFGGRATQRGLGDLESQLRAAMAGQQQAMQTGLAGFQPFQQAGGGAVQQELGMLQAGADPTAQVSQILGAFQQSPAQRATIQAGLEAVQNRLQAQGLGASGAQQRALEQFAQQQTAGQQQQFLQNVMGARAQTLGGLGQLGGLGLGAAGGAAQLGLRGQEDISSLLASLGQTQLAQQQARGGMGAGVLGGITSILQSIL